MRNVNKQSTALLIFTLAAGIFIGVQIGALVINGPIRVDIEEPEVYSHIIQELESIPEIERFTIERVRYSRNFTGWDLYVNLRDDVSFNFETADNLEQLKENINRIKAYTGRD